MTSGLLDTSVVIDWHDPIVLAALPDELAISAITAAELAAGPHLAATSAEAAKRQARLQEVEAKLEPLRFDGTTRRVPLDDRLSGTRRRVPWECGSVSRERILQTQRLVATSLAHRRR